MAFSRRMMVRRRRSNASRIFATADRSPLTAARPAAWETLATLDHAGDWRVGAGLATALGPIIQPTRQPVMAYVLATPLRMSVRSASSGTTTGIEENSASP